MGGGASNGGNTSTNATTTTTTQPRPLTSTPLSRLRSGACPQLKVGSTSTRARGATCHSSLERPPSRLGNPVLRSVAAMSLRRPRLSPSWPWRVQSLRRPARPASGASLRTKQGRRSARRIRRRNVARASDIPLARRPRTTRCAPCARHEHSLQPMMPRRAQYGPL